MDRNKYFYISLNDLETEKETLPFHLYLYNSVNETYEIIVPANIPLIKEKKEELKKAVNRDCLLCVLLRQKTTFLKCFDKKEDDIDSLRKLKKIEFLTKRIKKEEKDKQNTENGDQKEKEENIFSKKDLKECLEKDSFTPLIDKIREQVLGFDVTVSSTVSLAISFCEKLLFEDNDINRVLVLSYLFSSYAKMDTEEILGELICSCYLHHIGLTQLDLRLLKRPHDEFSKSEKKTYQKHLQYSLHLIKKGKIEVNENVISIMANHHEKYDGTGYPNGFKGDQIPPLSLILGAFSHIVDLSSGKITGESVPLIKILSAFKNKTMISGLEFGFGDIIDSNLIGIAI